MTYVACVVLAFSGPAADGAAAKTRTVKSELARLAASGRITATDRNDPDFAAAVARGTGYVPYTMIVVPLVPDDVAVGVLTVLDKRDGSFYDIGDLARAGMFADLALAAIDAEPGARAALTTAIAP